MALLILRLGVADAVDVADLFARSRRAAMPWLPVLHTPAEDRVFFAGQIASAGGWGAWESESAADESGTLVGFAIARAGWLDHLYVAPDARGRGIGSRLLAEVLVDQSGPVRLWAFERNVEALAFYARHGFAEVERTDGRGNEEGEPDVLLTGPSTKGS